MMTRSPTSSASLKRHRARVLGDAHKYAAEHIVEVVGHMAKKLKEYKADEWRQALVFHAVAGR